MRRAVLAAACSLMLVGCGFGSSENPPEHTVMGTLTLVFIAFGSPSDLPWKDVQQGGQCAPHGTWASDVQEGRDVLIKDGAGNIIGKTQLETGVRKGVSCQFGYVLDGVPDAQFYVIEIGSHKSQVYSLDDMKKADWKVAQVLTSD